MSSKFKKIWENNLKGRDLPDKCSGTIKIHYSDLEKLCYDFDEAKADNLIKELISGKVLIVKEAYKNKEVSEIKQKIINFWKKNPSTYHKMIEGCPDFHRVITPEVAKQYAVGAVRHTTYFFPWNNDPCGINEKVYEKWRICKYVAGLDYQEYENNTPKDGSIDRIQVVCYPPKYGGVENHTDTNSNSPLAISCYLSKRGEDFSTGGFYCLNFENKVLDIEPEIDSGDISLYCPTIIHGVEAIDSSKKLNTYDWNSGIGRWWMGLFTNDSNLKSNRKTSQSLETYHSEKMINAK